MRSAIRWAVALVAAAGVVLSAAAPSFGAANDRYIVLYKAQAVPTDAAAAVTAAGGSVVASYDAIGVVVARSTSAGFRDALARDPRVDGVAPTADFASRVPDDDPGASGPPPGDLPNAPASDADTLSSQQWDMRQIQAPQAHGITGGSPAVVVGDIDTGLDWTHPDLAQNVDFSRSASCVGGVADPNPAAWQDVDGHGTHTAGTIAAASNGLGIVGVAPNVKLAGIKAGDDAGFFFPEAVVCAFMWAGTHQIDVTNNSYFADPFLYNCRNDAAQRAIWKAEQRAIRFAMTRGVTVVAAEGNENQDLSHPTTDVISPDFPPGSAVEREVTNACVVVPVEIPGVVGVTADGNLRQKSYYSSYGQATADVVAPGGDRRFQVTPEAPNGRVLSTYPRAAFDPKSALEEESCLPDGVCATYAYLQGTSMASPHVAGVAALIVSRYGKSGSPQNGKMRPEQVAALLQQTADPMDCPPNPFNPGPPFNFTATCQGGPGHNSFYGSGQVNALRAVTHDAGNGAH